MSEIAEDDEETSMRGDEIIKKTTNLKRFKDVGGAVTQPTPFPPNKLIDKDPLNDPEDLM